MAAKQDITVQDGVVTSESMTSGHFQATFLETKLDRFNKMSRELPAVFVAAELGRPKDDLLLILTNQEGGADWISTSLDGLFTCFPF